MAQQGERKFIFFPGALFSEKFVKPSTSMMVIFGVNNGIGNLDKSYGLEPRIVFQLAPKTEETVNINGRELPTYGWSQEAAYYISGINDFMFFIKNIKKLLEAYIKGQDYSFEMSNPGKGKKIIFEIAKTDKQNYVKISYLGPGIYNGKKGISISLKDRELNFFEFLIKVSDQLPIVLSNVASKITDIHLELKHRREEKTKSSNKENTQSNHSYKQNISKKDASIEELEENIDGNIDGEDFMDDWI